MNQKMETPSDTPPPKKSIQHLATTSRSTGLAKASELLAPYKKPAMDLMFSASFENTLQNNPIANISKYKPQDLRQVIHGLLTVMCEQFNLSRPPSQSQIVGMVETFVRDYPTDSIDDIAYFCQQAAKGEYGATYGGLDQATVFGWYRKYSEMKWEKKDDLYKQQKHQQKIDEEIAFTEDLSDATLKARQELFKKFNTPKKVRSISVVNPNAYIPKKSKEQLQAEGELMQQDQSILNQLKDMDFADTPKEDIKGYILELKTMRATESAEYLQKILDGTQDEASQSKAG